jgi:hypothetical protein
MCASTFTAGLFLIFCASGIATVISLIVGFVGLIRRSHSDAEPTSN